MGKIDLENDIMAPPRHWLSGEELCPVLWGQLERAADLGGIDLDALKTHILYCDTCLPELFEASIAGVKASRLNAGNRAMGVFLLKKMKAIADEVRAEARAPLPL